MIIGTETTTVNVVASVVETASANIENEIAGTTTIMTASQGTETLVKETPATCEIFEIIVILFTVIERETTGILETETCETHETSTTHGQ